MRSRIVLHVTLAAILVGGGFLGWHVLHSDGTATTSSSSLVTASKANVLTTVSASGNVTSANEQSLSFPTAGTVTSISVKVGDHVTAGQQLAQIDDTAAVTALVTAKAALETAEDNYTAVANGTAPGNGTGTSSSSASANATSNGSGGSNNPNAAPVVTTTTTTTVPPTTAQLDTAYAKVLSARADATTALQNLGATTLRAPSDGTVAAVNGTVGESSSTSSGSSASAASATGTSSGTGSASGAAGGATSGSSTGSSSSSAFITLIDLSNYEVSVPFTEADSIGVQPGAAATLSVSAISKTFTGKVSTVGLIGTTSNSVVNYDATVTFDPGQDVSQVKPGMTTQVSIVTQKADAVVTLPSADITTTGTWTTLNVVGANGKTQSRLVTIGLRGDDNVEIASGLSAGEKVKITRTSSAASTGATGFGGGGFGGGGLGGGLGGAGGGATRRFGGGTGGAGGAGG